MSDLKPIALPDLAEGVTQATIVEWLVKPGEAFDAGAVLVEIMTDKVALEVEAEEAGTLAEIAVGDDTEVPAGTVLGHYRPGSAA